MIIGIIMDLIKNFKKKNKNLFNKKLKNKRRIDTLG